MNSVCKSLTFPLFSVALWMSVAQVEAKDEQPPGERIQKWDFADGTSEWGNPNDCELSVVNGVLKIRSTGEDPFFLSPPIQVVGPLTVKLRLKCDHPGKGQIFWITEKSAENFYDESESVFFDFDGGDDQWHDYTVYLDTNERLRGWRLDLGRGPVEVEVKWIELYSTRPQQPQAKKIPKAETQGVNPYPRQPQGEKIQRWDFANGISGWGNPNQCELSVVNGALKIRATGEDPFFLSPPIQVDGPLIVKLRLKCNIPSKGQIFWMTEKAPTPDESKSVFFDFKEGGQWNDYAVFLDTKEKLSVVRLDLGRGPVEGEVEWIELCAARFFPLELLRLETQPKQITLQLKNHDPKPVEFSVAGRDHTIAGEQTMPVVLPLTGSAPVEAVEIEVKLKPKGTSAARRTVFVYRPEAAADWVLQKSGEVTLQVARDGSCARLERNGAVAAVLAPLAQCDGNIPKLKPAEQPQGGLRLTGEGLAIDLSLKGEELSVSIQSDRECEGPVLRTTGSLQQGLFAGLEYLGKGETSSSKLDIETDEHLRFAPDPVKVTMPLMACVTDGPRGGSVAMTWKSMSLQPVFATPNFLDGTADHRMALRGKKIDATILIGKPQGIEELILWAVNKQGGLPPLPSPPRARQQQLDLCLQSLNGPLKNEFGWGHCAESNFERHPYADQISTIFRLTGNAPETPTLALGGGGYAQAPNDAVFFVTGRVNKWLEAKSNQIRGILGQQKQDGSFRYTGELLRGHFENTASGYCARNAVILLDYARATGDSSARDAGLKTLEFMKRFRTPRGAQSWEVPLHTPDILASALLVWAYVRGYELTGNTEYLQQARRWALSGIPFVYLWSRYPIMLYQTGPLYGATYWKYNWMGLPLPWCGVQYGYALALLTPHDKTLNWKHLAEGLLIAAEQTQYVDGDRAGCMPDVFTLQTQRRSGPSINPSSLVNLRLVLEGRLDNLAVAADGKHRVAAPFPVSIQDGKARVQGPKGIRYQVLIDGQRIVEITSSGEDIVALDAK
ncbi:MAG: hypothetical protein HY360_25470 [Verrucomicrobia bacterium]|nr:hypothetical protein [Verrucomicrobiota bacterium]